jgi:hypothetical protein
VSSVIGAGQIRRGHSALRHAATREALLASARREARMSRGRDHFLVHERVLPIGLPLASALGIVAWQLGARGRHGRRSRERGAALAVGAALAAVAGTWAIAALEWTALERDYRQENGRDV